MLIAYDQYFGRIKLVGIIVYFIPYQKSGRVCAGITGRVYPEYALRDIKDLIAKDILAETEEGGRSANYVLRD